MIHVFYLLLDSIMLNEIVENFPLSFIPIN